MADVTHEAKQSSEVAEPRRASKLTAPMALGGVEGMLLGLQRTAGNRATQRAVQRLAAGVGPNRLPVLQRHGAPEDDPLEVQAKHDPQLQRHGAPEEDPLEVQAKHDLSQRAAIQREESGIAGTKALGKYVAGVKELQDGWDKLSAAARGAAIGKEANKRLKDAGVPACTIDVQSMAIGTNGNFDFTTWTINVNKIPLEQATITTNELAEIADTMYHEARHCEQWFRIARFLAGTKGKTAKDIATEMFIPESIAKKAVASPLKKSSALAAKFASKSTLAMEQKMLNEAAAWYANIYGAGGDARSAVLNNLQPTGDAYREAKKNYDDGYLAAETKNNVSAAEYNKKKLFWEQAQAAVEAFIVIYQGKVAKGNAGPGDIVQGLALEGIRDSAELEKDAALATWQADWDAMDKLTKDLESTGDAARDAHAKYKALTEETDAWALGGRVQDAYKKKK